MRIEPHRPLDRLERLGRPAGEAQRAGERDVAVGVVGVGSRSRASLRRSPRSCCCAVHEHGARRPGARAAWDRASPWRGTARPRICASAVAPVSRPIAGPQIARVDLPIDRRERRVGAAVVRVDLGGLLEVGDRGAELLRRLPQIVLPAFQEARRTPGRCPVPRLATRSLSSLVNSTASALTTLRVIGVLQAEDVLQVAVVAIGPHVTAGCGVDQLRIDPHAVAAAPHAAFEHVADVERLARSRGRRAPCPCTGTSSCAR